MIDYEQFFFELRDLYLANGLEFNHELKDVKRNISSSRHVGILKDVALDKDLLGEEKFPKDSLKPTNKKIPFQNGIKIDNNKLFNKAMWRFYKSFEEFVYSTAYELAEKIGRLPDAMHSRMILSTDDSPARKNYVLKFG
jgi:hypothetical protein